MSNAADSSRKALGKGLSALLPASRAASPAAAAAPKPETKGGAALQVPIWQIEPNPLQPRTVFQAEKLEGLAQSIKANGIIQPLIVGQRGDRYQLVAGERRWRAAQIAGLETVPVIVQEIASDRMLEVALVENIQRADLNPIEVAQAFERLGRELGLSHEMIAARTGKDRSTVTNLLRLLRLPADIQLLLAEERLSMGHARAILGLPTPDVQIQVAEKAAAEGMSVRQVERLVQKMTTTHEPKTVEQAAVDPNVKAALEELERVLGTRVRITEKSENRGRLEIEYYSMEDLTRIYEVIVGESAE